MLVISIGYVVGCLVTLIYLIDSDAPQYNSGLRLFLTLQVLLWPIFLLITILYIPIGCINWIITGEYLPNIFNLQQGTIADYISEKMDNNK